MASVRIIINSENLNALFQRLIQAVRNPRPALEDLGNRLVLMARQAFEDEASPEGAPWAPLSPSYALFKAQAGKEGLLQFSTALLRSIDKEVAGNTVIVGSAAPYAAVHQFGHVFPPMTIVPRNAQALRFFSSQGNVVFAKSARVPERRVPARPFLPAPATAERVAKETLEDHLEEAIGGR